MDFCKIFLQPKEDIRIRHGHPWVYGNEIERIEGVIKSGEIAYVCILSLEKVFKYNF